MNCPAFNRQAETKLGQDAIVYRRVARGGRGFVSNHRVSLHLLLEVALDAKIIAKFSILRVRLLLKFLPPLFRKAYISKSWPAEVDFLLSM